MAHNFAVQQLRTAAECVNKTVGDNTPPFTFSYKHPAGTVVSTISLNRAGFVALMLKLANQIEKEG